MTSSELTESEPEVETAPAQESTTQSQKSKRRLPRLLRVGIQSKLLVTLLVCSIMSVAVVGLIGALSGRSALREVESERLIELRESQKRQVEALFKEVTNSLIIYSGGFSIVEATTSLTAGFAQLANATITPAQQQAIVNYYNNEMLKPIKQATGDVLDLNAVLPSSNAQKYLQAYYTAAVDARLDAC